MISSTRGCGIDQRDLDFYRKTLCSLLGAVFGTDEDGKAVIECSKPEVRDSPLHRQR